MADIIMADLEDAWSAGPRSETSALQELVNIYVTIALQLILTDPWISAPQILFRISTLGWAGSREQILRRFGGWGVFSRTIQRMETLRAGAVNDRLMDFPIAAIPLTVSGFGDQLPDIDGYIAWWAPQMEDQDHPFTFSISRARGGVLHRYPHENTDTEESSDGEEYSSHLPTPTEE